MGRKHAYQPGPWYVELLDATLSYIHAISVLDLFDVGE
jgi:hypothetical protein